MAEVQGRFKAFCTSGFTFKGVFLVTLATFAALVGFGTCSPSTLPASALSSAPGHLEAHNLALGHASPSLAAPKAHHQRLHHKEARSPARPAIAAPVPAWMALDTFSPTACLAAAASVIASLLFIAAATRKGCPPRDAAPYGPHPAPPTAVTQSLKRARSLSVACCPTPQQQQQQRVRTDQRRLAAWLASAVQSQQAAVQRCVELHRGRLAAMRQDLDARRTQDQGRHTGCSC